MATILTIINNVLKRTGTGEPISTAVGNNDKTARQALAILEKAGQEAAGAYEWPELQKEYTISLIANQAAYPMPQDIDYVLYHTNWDRSQAWPIQGPMTPEEWQYRKSGIATASPYSRFRVKGMANNQFYLEPTPSESAIAVLEYATATWVKPADWAATASYTTDAFSFYDGNIYKTALGGTTGSTAPTHTWGSVSDGGVIWSHYGNAYDTIQADTDTPVIRNNIIEDEFEWRWLREKGQTYAEKRIDSESAMARATTDAKGASVINLKPGYSQRFISVDNAPDSNLGDV